MNSSNNHTKELIVGIGSLLVAAGIRVLTRKLWTQAKGTPPPENPAEPGVKMHEAVIWTISLAVLSGLGKMLLKKKFTDIIPDDDHEITGALQNLNE